MNKFKFSDNNKRYYTLDYFYKQKFNSKVFKISLDAGFSCPNLDGTLSNKGCLYCDKGASQYAGNSNDDLVMQFNKIKTMMHKKWKDGYYIGYFQVHTNTYASVNELRSKYETILNLDNVIGIDIATRPDAISDECLEYLKELNKKTYLTIELGLQTIHEKTAKLINRCHSLDCFKETVKRLRDNNINVVVHIINGLPDETKEMMLETVKYLNDLDIQGIKIHMLYITKGTGLEDYYNEHKFKILSKDEYIDIVCDQLEVLNDNIVIHRITGDPKKEDLVAPLWLIKKFVVLNDIDKELKRRDSYQGIKNRTV